jgi:hypothetical protein
MWDTRVGILLTICSCAVFVVEVVVFVFVFVFVLVFVFIFVFVLVLVFVVFVLVLVLVFVFVFVLILVLVFVFAFALELVVKFGAGGEGLFVLASGCELDLVNWGGEKVEIVDARCLVCGAGCGGGAEEVVEEEELNIGGWVIEEALGLFPGDVGGSGGVINANEMFLTIVLVGRGAGWGDGVDLGRKAARMLLFRLFAVRVTVVGEEGGEEDISRSDCLIVSTEGKGVDRSFGGNPRGAWSGWGELESGVNALATVEEGERTARVRKLAVFASLLVVEDGLGVFGEYVLLDVLATRGRDFAWVEGSVPCAKGEDLGGEGSMGAE